MDVWLVYRINVSDFVLNASFVEMWLNFCIYYTVFIIKK